MTEERQEFAMLMKSIDEKEAPCEAAYLPEQPIDAAERLSYPVLIRVAFALGDLGSGFAYKEKRRFDAIGHVSVRYDQSTLKVMRRLFVNIRPFSITNDFYTTKGLERNIVRSGIRDNFDNCITVCNMENIDPLGIHTGVSRVSI